MPRRYRTPIEIGAVVGYWTVIATADPIIENAIDRRRGRIVHRRVAVRRFLCRCRCGVERAVKGSALIKPREASNSCGCYQRERTSAIHQSHGESYLHGRSPEYQTWMSMKSRCYIPTTTNFRHYGGRGIQVCKEWRDSYEAFLADVGRKPTPRHSIDRIDVNGHYEPGNVRWATPREQRANRRENAA